MEATRWTKAANNSAKAVLIMQIGLRGSSGWMKVKKDVPEGWKDMTGKCRAPLLELNSSGLRPFDSLYYPLTTDAGFWNASRPSLAR